MNNKIVILGNGLLGSELKKQSGWDCISRKENGFDITDSNCFDKHLIETFDGMVATPKYNVIVNCIAHTDTYSKEKNKHWDINYKGVAELSDFCNKWNIKLIHISTDYVYSGSKSVASEEDVPVHLKTWYGYTKLLAEGYIQLKLNNYLIIRTSHKPYPFPYTKAWKDQVTNGDYVNVISDLIIKLINKEATGIINVGTYTKTWWGLTINEFDTTPINRDTQAPSDVSMSLTKLHKILFEKAE